jgi:hypothetical protein
MLQRGAKAQLFLDGQCVGDVAVVSSSAGWGFGEFRPNETFSKFAMLFGRWSLLLHAQGEGERLNEAAHEALRDAEQAMDGVRAKLFELSRQTWHPVGQINIDAGLVEWKEY